MLRLKPLHLLVCMSVLSHTALSGTRISVILYAVHLQASPAVAGILGALLSVVAMFTSVMVGRWLDRSGPRMPMLVGCVMSSVGMAIGFVWPGLAVLFVINILVGTFNNMFFIVNQNLVGQYGRPEDRVGNFSLSGLGYSTAAFIGPMIAGFAIDSFGHPATFLLLAVLPMIPAVVIGFDKMEFPPRQAPAAPRADGAAEASTLQLILDRKLGPIFFASALSQATWNLFAFLMPIHLASLALSASTIGAIVASFYFASMVSRFFLPWIARHFTPWQLLLASFAGGGLSFFGFTMTDHLAWVVALSVWLGLVLGFTGPMVMTLLYEASPEGRTGKVVGVRVMLMNLTQTIVPLLAGAVGAAFGVAPAFWFLGAALMGGGWSARRESLRYDRRGHS